MRNGGDILDHRNLETGGLEGADGGLTARAGTLDENFDGLCDNCGERLNDALDIVTHYIDDAIMLGIGTVRIIHGKGSGVLREEIQKYLRTVPGLTVSDEDIRNGGTGVTIVKL